MSKLGLAMKVSIDVGKPFFIKLSNIVIPVSFDGGLVAGVILRLFLDYFL
jgi:hypothetical protein